MESKALIGVEIGEYGFRNRPIVTVEPEMDVGEGYGLMICMDDVDDIHGRYFSMMIFSWAGFVLDLIRSLRAFRQA